jgi:hypothetical protein
MRINAVYFLKELAEQFKTRRPPPHIDATVSPHLAWLDGYLSALKDITDAMIEKEEA